MPNFTADELRQLLQLEPLTIEGGFFRETYRSDGHIPQSALPATYTGPRAFSTCIYYLLTPDTFSVIHRLPGEEIFHFYLGDPVEMLQLHPGGRGELITLGSDLRSGMRVQHIVPGNVWQGSRLKDGGRFALMGTTVAPGFDYDDYQAGDRDELSLQYPSFSEAIRRITPNK
jgi:predicted cupin superfamily sugar epimerase